jgi:hypothetical protein
MSPQTDRVDVARVFRELTPATDAPPEPDSGSRDGFHLWRVISPDEWAGVRELTGKEFSDHPGTVSNEAVSNEAPVLSHTILEQPPATRPDIGMPRVVPEFHEEQSEQPAPTRPNDWPHGLPCGKGIDLDLMRVVDAWPMLTGQARKAVLAVLELAKSG